MDDDFKEDLVKRIIEAGIAGVVGVGIIFGAYALFGDKEKTDDDQEKDLDFSKNSNEAVIEKTNMSPLKMILEPGKSIITYSYVEERETVENQINKYLESNIITPDGYELYGKQTIERTNNYGHVYYQTLFTFINVEKVEVLGMYNPDTNEFVFSDPGKVVKEQSLTLK